MNFSLRRKVTKRRYRKIFLVSPEGVKTEPSYFARVEMLLRGEVHFLCLSNRDNSSPSGVLAKMKSEINRVSLRPGDEAWLVVDKDQWRDDQMKPLVDWVKESDANRGLAVSNPKFELWLILHFEDLAREVTSQMCSGLVGRYIPSYNKDAMTMPISLESIRVAIVRAKRLCVDGDYPARTGTTVYRLLEHVITNSQ